MTPLLFASLALIACAPRHDDTSAPSDTGVDPGPITLPASTFLMGCTDGQSDCDDDETEHSVTLTHDYYAAATEVTEAEFESVMGYNPSALTDCGADCPVETVSWYEAAAYTNAVSAAAGLTGCYACTGAGSDVVCDVAVDPYDCEGYRLLTEAEWEGAARCGTDVTYAGSNDVSAVAWTSANSGGTKHAVGGLDSNACGLRDLSGNVWEWTGDYYGEYGSAPATDPAGPATGSGRVIRGGGFGGGAADARVAERAGRYGEYGYDALGFRLGRTDP